MIKLLFVCMGNICRSPTAHAVMQHKINQAGIRQDVVIESAGTHAYHVGEKSDARSRAKAKEKGIDMEFIRARKISVLDYDNFDWIFAMDRDNLELINYYAPDNHSAQIELFLARAHARGKVDCDEVPDPYYGSGEGFERVFRLVDAGADVLLSELCRR